MECKPRPPLTAVLTRMSPVNAIYLLLTVACSLFAFILYGIDKRRAVKKKPRISERTLHVLSMLGGWPGAHLAQRIFHHKTLKISFRLVFWLTVTVHLLIIAYAFWSGWPIAAVRNVLGF